MQAFSLMDNPVLGLIREARTPMPKAEPENGE